MKEKIASNNKDIIKGTAYFCRFCDFWDFNVKEVKNHLRKEHRDRPEVARHIWNLIPDLNKMAK